MRIYGALGFHLGIPMIFIVDVDHDYNNVYGAIIFPHNISHGATRNTNLMK